MSEHFYIILPPQQILNLIILLIAVVRKLALGKYVINSWI